MNKFDFKKCLTYRVTQMNALTNTIMQIIAEPHNDILHRLQYQAGHYIEIALDEHQHRPFSIANAPLGTGHLEFHIRHTPSNDFIQALFDHIEKTGEIRVAGPFGQCTFPQNDSPILFIAGGTGFAPHKALIEFALAKNKTNPLHLIWGASTFSDLYLHESTLKWQQHVPHFHYTPVLTNAPTLPHWQGEIGRVQDTISEQFHDLSEHSIFIAGPFEMVQTVRQCVLALGAKPENIHSDI